MSCSINVSTSIAILLVIGLRYWQNARKADENLAQLTGWSKTAIEQKTKAIQSL